MLLPHPHGDEDFLWPTSPKQGDAAAAQASYSTALHKEKYNVNDTYLLMKKDYMLQWGKSSSTEMLASWHFSSLKKKKNQHNL